VLELAATFYQQQLDRHPEALDYLKRRGLHDPASIQGLRIGYAPGASLRRHLTAQGYPFDLLRRLGLLNPQGWDAFYRRFVFPCCQAGRIVNFYGRSIGGAFAHRFLPGSKGGLYGWEQVRQCPEVILVEGLFDYAVLWQAGFRHVTCSLGTYLNACQFRQLCGRRRIVYLAFDVDANGSGQQASERLAHRLQAQGIATRRVLLPDGHDPNSFFVQGGDARQFQSLLEAAQP
jgi:DNA primase